MGIEEMRQLNIVDFYDLNVTNLGKVIMSEKNEKSERGCGVRSDSNYTRITV